MSQGIDTVRRLRDLTTIAEIGLKLASEMDLDSLLQLVCFYGTVLLEGERATLFLMDTEGGELVAKNTHGHPDPTKILGRAFEGALVVQLATDEATRFIVVPEAQRRLFPFLDKELGGAAIISNILGKRGLLGVLAVEQKVDQSDFSDYDGEVLERLVAQAGIAIENAEILADLDGKVGQINRELADERARNEHLLHDLLPPTMVEELRQEGSVTPRRFDAGTLLCAHLVPRDPQADPATVFPQLGPFYGRLDEIVGRHGLVRIKTMGDRYVAGAGIVSPRESHAIDAAGAALEIENFLRDQGAAEGLQASIALSSGTGVAGVVGGSRFAFEVVSDAMVVGFRLAGDLPAGEIAATTATFQLIDHAFVCERRGSVWVAGAGDVTWYAVGRVRI